MRCDVTTALKELNLHGMANAWTELTAKEEGETKIAPSRWLIEHLLKAEHTDRAMRSVSYQIKAALVHKALKRRKLSRSCAFWRCASWKHKQHHLRTWHRLVAKPSGE